MARARSVLISGCGIAGATLAYWLERGGMRPVIVESAPRLRTGGYMIDFWGPGFEVAERMNLLGSLSEVGYRVRELRLVNRAGARQASVPMEPFISAAGGRLVSLLRGDLASLLFAAVEPRVETIFGDEITAISEEQGRVDVRFARGGSRTFDLVVGADGVHSAVRRLVFGGARHERDLGYRVAAFTSARFPVRDDLVYVSRTIAGTQVARFTLRDGRTVFFVFLGAESAAPPAASGANEDELKRFLERRLQQFSGNEVPHLLRALRDCRDLYFDSVVQVRMPQWAKGGVALVGDAAYSPSLLAGQGASLAMAGAYVLAGELTRYQWHKDAFDGYERQLRPLMLRKQRAARLMGGWFAPPTRAGLYLRNAVTRVAGNPWLAGLLAPMMFRRTFPMPDYSWPRVRAVRIARQS